MLDDNSRSKIYLETKRFMINTLLYTIIFYYARDNDILVARDFSLLLAPSCAENTRTDTKGPEETSDSNHLTPAIFEVIHNSDWFNYFEKFKSLSQNLFNKKFVCNRI